MATAFTVCDCVVLLTPATKALEAIAADRADVAGRALLTGAKRR